MSPLIKAVPQVLIVRDVGDDSFGVFGQLSTEMYECYTLERPRTGDHPCIPAGEYEVELRPHPRHGECYEVMDVPGRTAILIHPANWYQELLGCIALGTSVNIIQGQYLNAPVRQMGITRSVDACQRFMDQLSYRDFHLTIR